MPEPKFCLAAILQKHKRLYVVLNRYTAQLGCELPHTNKARALKAASKMTPPTDYSVIKVTWIEAARPKRKRERHKTED